MPALESPRRQKRLSALRRTGPLAARIAIAVFGGYALGALASVATLVLPLPAAQAVIAGMLASFLVYAGVAIWAFHAWSGRGMRQNMSGLHTWAGLLAGWLLYAMFLTGTVSYFRDEISQWMRPEIAQRQTPPDPAAAAQRIVDTLQTEAAGSPQWSMQLPTARSNVASVFWRLPDAAPGANAYETATFDPDTGRKLAARDTLGGDFFYLFHFQFYYLPILWGRWLAGLCAMFMLTVLISGIITHKKIFADFFTFRGGKGQRSWLDAHNAFAVFGLPFHLMITYSGLAILMTLYMPWGAMHAVKTPDQQREFNAQLYEFIEPGAPARIKAPLARVDAMVRQARARWGMQAALRVTIADPGDANARVAVSRADSARVSMSPQYLLFDGVTGRLLQARDRVGAAAETRGVLYALHRGRFGDTPLRWLYFIVSLAGTAMVGTGLVMWTVKRRQKLADPQRPHVGFRLVERLNIAAIAGLSIAMTAYLWANRLLPLSTPHRAAAEVDVFFAAWSATLLYAVLRPARRAWIELLWFAAAVMALLPVLNALSTRRPFWHSVATHDWVYAGFDLAMWAFAALHATFAVCAARHRPGPQALRAPRAASPGQQA